MPISPSKGPKVTKIWNVFGGYALMIGTTQIDWVEFSQLGTAEIVVICIAGLVALLLVISLISLAIDHVLSLRRLAFKRVRPEKVDPSIPDAWEVMTWAEREVRRQDYEEVFLPTARFARYGFGCVFYGSFILMFAAVAIVTGESLLMSICDTLDLDPAPTGQFALWAALTIGLTLSLFGTILMFVFRRAPSPCTEVDSHSMLSNQGRDSG